MLILLQHMVEANHGLRGIHEQSPTFRAQTDNTLTLLTKQLFAGSGSPFLQKWPHFLTKFLAAFCIIATNEHKSRNPNENWNRNPGQYP